MRADVLAIGTLLLGGCALSHERDAPAVDATSPAHDTSLCVTGTPATLRFEPPFTGFVPGVRVVLLRVTADAPSGGVRFDLDTCGGTPVCPLTMFVSGVGDGLMTRVRVPTGASGSLTTDERTAVLRLLDERDCAGCGGELSVIAGSLARDFDHQFPITPDTVICSDTCGDTFDVSLTSVRGVDLVRVGAPIDVPLRYATLVSDAIAPCTRCDCGLPARPATGIVAEWTGSFAP